ncbi:MAG: hypothetical protein K6D97_02890 [Clostridia bacterium]|nr:hypothetical protein [Clostridia bacterium]
MKKLAIFIKNLPDASEKDKTYFMNSYLNDERKFTEKLFEIIDNLDDSKKAEYEAKIFEKYFYNRITYNVFLKYSYDLARIDVADLVAGYKEINNRIDRDEDGNIRISNNIGGSFLGIGMAEILTYPGTCGFSLNDNGIKFLGCIFD